VSTIILILSVPIAWFLISAVLFEKKKRAAWKLYPQVLCKQGITSRELRAEFKKRGVNFSGAELYLFMNELEECGVVTHQDVPKNLAGTIIDVRWFKSTSL